MVRIHVREAVEADAEKVARLIARLKLVNEELDPHFKTVPNLEEVALEYARKAITGGDTRVLVAEDEETGEIVGVLVYTLVDRVFYEPRIKALITDFYVKARYRGRRVGSLLLEKAAEKAKTDGAGILTVVYPAGNNIAAGFYERKGFRDLQVEKYRPLD